MMYKLPCIDVIHEMNESLKPFIDNSIDSIYLKFYKNVLVLEKTKFFEEFGKSRIFLSEIVELNIEPSEQYDYYKKILEGEIQINEEIFEWGKIIRLFKEEHTISNNFLPELKMKFPDMINENIYSVKVFEMYGNKSLLLYKISEDRNHFIFEINLEEVDNQVKEYLIENDMYSYLEGTNFDGCSDVTELKDEIITTNKYYIKEFLYLFNDKTEKELDNGYKKYYKKLKKNDDFFSSMTYEEEASFRKIVLKES